MTMPENRPAIPTDIQRVIFLEAGHRCACCGVPFPLERAHIVPWKKAKEHTADNLICLCANCHEMADHSNGWDKETFFAYKKNPWVNRQHGSASVIKHSRNPAILDYVKTATDAFCLQERYALKAVEDTQNDTDGLEIQKKLNDLIWSLRAQTKSLLELNSAGSDLGEALKERIEAVYTSIVTLHNWFGDITRKEKSNLSEIADCIAKLNEELHK
jgi:hypothetical protein